MCSNFDMQCIIHVLCVSWTKIHAGINFYFMNVQANLPLLRLYVILAEAGGSFNRNNTESSVIGPGLHILFKSKGNNVMARTPNSMS